MMQEENTKKEKKIDNFTEIDIEVLELQNKSLVTEVLRLRSLLKNKEDLGQSDKTMCKNKREESIKLFLNKLKANLNKSSEPSNKQWIQSFFQALDDLFSKLIIELDVSSTNESECLTDNNNISLLINQFELEIRNLTQFKYSDMNEDKFKEILEGQRKEILKMKEEQFAINTVLNTKLELKEELETLKWKNKVLENRMAFITTLNNKDIEIILKQVEDPNIDLCFCGGKNFYPIKQDLIESAKQRLVVEKKEAKSVQFSEDTEKISLLKKEIESLIDISEKRLVDKKMVGFQILNSSFISEIKNYLNSYYDYVQQIETRISGYAECLGEIEQLRKNELDEYRKRENKEKSKLYSEIKSLRAKIQDYENSLKKNKFVKLDTERKTSKKGKSDEFETIIKLKNEKIMKLNAYYKEREEKLVNKEKTIENLEKRVQQLKDNKYDELQLLDKEFRHQTHKRLFGKIYERFKDDKEDYQEMKKMEMYIKMRDDKIRKYERKLKKAENELKRETDTSKMLIDEVTHSSVAFSKLQSSLESQSKNLITSEENFNRICKEKNEEQMKFEMKIGNLENKINYLEDKKKLMTEAKDNMKESIKHKEKEYNSLEQKFKNISALYQDLQKENGFLKAQNNAKNTQLDIFEKKTELLEQSKLKLSKQISENLDSIAEKELLLKKLLNTEGVKGLKGDVTDVNRNELIVNKLEIQRMKNLVQCKVCKDRDINVLLKNCYHTFCRKCIEQKIRNRDRNCPVCMIGFNKLDIQTLYLG